MGLFSPWFLAGALAVGLPIWLHLLKRSKTDPTPFPSLRFFENREVPSVHRRLDYLLLFALRALMVLLLALLFAHPYLETLTAVGRGEELTVIAVDRSFSMSAGPAVGQTRLDQAKAQALEALTAIPNGQQAQVVALAGNLEAMTQQINDPAELQAAIGAIEPSDSRASFGELARYLRTLRDSTEKPLEVHLFSDLQESALPPGFADLRLEPNTEMIFHPIGETEPNWTVETVVSPDRIYDPEQTHIIATVAGFNTPEAQRSVTLHLNGKQVAQQTVTVPENGRGSTEFVGLEASYGYNQAEVRIDSADNLAKDDVFRFAVERTDPRRILFVDEGRSVKAQQYFEAAMGSTPEEEFTMEIVQAPQAAQADLSRYAMVVLSDLGTVPDRLNSALEEYVTGGGSVFVVLGPNSVALERAPVLDEVIEGSRYAAREGERFWAATDIDIAHPSLANVERLEGVRFYQATGIQTENSDVLARLSEGTPLLVERKIGEGTVLAFTSTIDNLSNDFPLKPVFVGFVQGTVDYLAGGGVDQPLNLAVDDYVEIRSADDEEGVTADVTGPDGERVLSLEESASAQNVTLAREGFYQINTAGGQSRTIAAHADRRESDLGTIPQETLDLWMATGGTAAATAGGGNLEGSLSDNTEPWSLAPFILMLLLGVALVESLVANRYLRTPAVS